MKALQVQSDLFSPDDAGIGGDAEPLDEGLSNDDASVDDEFSDPGSGADDEVRSLRQFLGT